jgi:hypothetical protein
MCTLTRGDVVSEGDLNSSRNRCIGVHPRSFNALSGVDFTRSSHRRSIQNTSGYMGGSIKFGIKTAAHRCALPAQPDALSPLQVSGPEGADTPTGPGIHFSRKRDSNVPNYRAGISPAHRNRHHHRRANRGTPAVVIVRWPAKPTILHPRRFPDAAATIAQLFARAHVVLAAIQAERKL